MKTMRNKGFTLIEILLVIGILAVLAAITVVALNPARRFAQANNSKRLGDITAIMDAIQQNIIDNQGVFNSSGCEGPLPTTAAVIASSTGETGPGGNGYDICGCLVPKYLGNLGVDPTNGSPVGGVTSCVGEYNTRYQIQADFPAPGQITITALDAQDADGDGNPDTIQITR